MVTCASRSLKSAEQYYSQLEEEALGIFIGFKRFRQYLANRRVQLFTNHKPLTFIFHPVPGVSPTALHHIQRWALYLANFSYTVKYRPGQNNFQSDLLSRVLDLFLKETALIASKPNSCGAHSRYALSQIREMLFHRGSRHNNVVEVRLRVRNCCEDLFDYRLKDGWRARKTEREPIHAVQSLVGCKHHVHLGFIVELQLKVGVRKV